MRLLWIGDAACDTGFARCTHQTLDTLRHLYDVHVLGLNYFGDPHPYPYPIYPAVLPNPLGLRDPFGVSRVVEVTRKVVPQMVVIQNDPWNIPAYVREFNRLTPRPLLVGAIAVDGKNCRGTDLNGLDHAIFWTAFAEEQARLGGFTQPASVIPLGVDLAVFQPGDRREARAALRLPDVVPPDAFLVLNVNRNQPRKRLDLTLEYFATFYHQYCARKDAYLYLHVCPTGDVGYDCDQLTGYYDLAGHVILAAPGVFQGSSDADMVRTYQAADVGMTTTQGEGWGLPTMEAMACGVPCLVPAWSALEEWATAAIQVPCTTTCVTADGINSIGGIADHRGMVNALATLYRNPQLRASLSARGQALVGRPTFRWAAIGAQFAEAIEGALTARTAKRAAAR